MNNKIKIRSHTLMLGIKYLRSREEKLIYHRNHYFQNSHALKQKNSGKL